jgi:hypothetical protein
MVSCGPASGNRTDREPRRMLPTSHVSLWPLGSLAAWPWCAGQGTEARFRRWPALRAIGATACEVVHAKLSQAGKPKKVIRVALARKLLIRLNAKARQARAETRMPRLTRQTVAHPRMLKRPGSPYTAIVGTSRTPAGVSGLFRPAAASVLTRTIARAIRTKREQEQRMSLSF